jgi:hypothetical protein
MMDKMWLNKAATARILPWVFYNRQGYVNKKEMLICLKKDISNKTALSSRPCEAA